MTKLRTALIAPVLCACLLSCSHRPDDGSEAPVQDPEPLTRMETEILAIMERAGIPAISCAILDGSSVAYLRTFGVKDTNSQDPADEETVFAAASFSKTVFAYLVMLLAEDGLVDLDRPLQEYLSRPLPDYPRYADLAGDDRYRLLTARMCLSHTTGFPNWRFFTEDGRLQFLFEPGERHSYSGEGIDLLQMVVEEITGQGLESLARDRIFEPLAMTRTGYVWQDGWRDNLALPHDPDQRPRPFNERHEADAAGSMATTAGDYAKFLAALLQAEGPRRATVDEMLKAQVPNRHAGMFGPPSRETSDAYAAIGLSWGLGFGRLDCGDLGRAFFHTGHDTGIQNYTVTYADRGVGVVLLSNSDNFESVARELVPATIGEDCSPFDWLGYPHFDPDRQD